MAEISKTVGQWIVANVGWTVVIALFILSGLFKITKIEINPIGWIVGWFGKALTSDVRKDVAKLSITTNAKLNELKSDYNSQIKALKTDLDGFETRTNDSISCIQKGTNSNCKLLKRELDEMKKSNDMQTVRQIKAHVLDFANSCMNKRRHSKQDFENIIEENAQYEALVKKYRLKNKVYEEDYAFVMKCYHECQENNSFLNSENGVEA